MTTLVTGVTGRVGSHFVPRLLAEGEHIRVLVRDAEAREELRERGTEVVEGDLRDPDALRRAVDAVDRVVHLAAAFRGVAEEEVVAVNQAAAVDLRAPPLPRASAASSLPARTSSTVRAAAGPHARATSLRPSTPTRNPRQLQKTLCGSCGATRTSACGSCASPSSTARATRTWRSR
jgi:uncharacterized protein YbjT (DUF2867 family)